MSSATHTVKSILGTVTDTANTLSDTVKTVGLGVGMVNSFVQNASIDQSDRQKIHRKTYRDVILTEAKMDYARRKVEVVEFIGSNELNATLFNDAEEYFKDMFND